jgi:hypothetical protein
MRYQVPPFIFAIYRVQLFLGKKKYAPKSFKFYHKTVGWDEER